MYIFSVSEQHRVDPRPSHAKNEVLIEGRCVLLYLKCYWRAWFHRFLMLFWELVVGASFLCMLQFRCASVIALPAWRLWQVNASPVELCFHGYALWSASERRERWGGHEMGELSEAEQDMTVSLHSCLYTDCSRRTSDGLYFMSLMLQTGEGKTSEWSSRSLTSRWGKWWISLQWTLLESEKKFLKKTFVYLFEQKSSR